MIRAIPNQPVNFAGSRLQGCCRFDPEDCLLLEATDRLYFQVEVERCPDDLQLLTDPGFEDRKEWTYTNWFLNDDGFACVTYNALSLSTYVLASSMVATPGLLYEITVNVSSFTLGVGGRGLDILFGGVVIATVTEPGVYTYFVTAAGTQGLRFDASDIGTGGSLCLNGALVYQWSATYAVDLMDADGNSSDVWLSTDTYEYPAFTIENGKLTVDLSLDKVDPGCYTVRIADLCTETLMLSGCVKVGTHPCTLVIKACNSSGILGFTSDFAPSIRVPAALRRASFEYEVAEERLSNGRLNRYFGERTRQMQLRIGGVGESVHEFLSSLPLWDHVFVGSAAYVVVADSYEPEYGDIYDAHGAITLRVTPFIEEARKSRCTAPDAGCPPPPNYLGLGDGNGDVLVTEDGEQIEINN